MRTENSNAAHHCKCPHDRTSIRAWMALNSLVAHVLWHWVIEGPMFGNINLIVLLDVIIGKTLIFRRLLSGKRILFVHFWLLGKGGMVVGRRQLGRLGPLGERHGKDLAWLPKVF